MDLQEMEHAFYWIVLGCRVLVLKVVFFLLRPFLSRSTLLHSTDEVMLHGDNGSGLLVVLNGYGSSRAYFARQVEQLIANLHESGKQYRRLYVPSVVYDQKRSIADANTHIYSTINEYHHQHDDERIDIIGVSAGGRLAVFLQYALRNTHVPMRVVTVGSPLNGTGLIPLVRRLPLGHKLLSHVVGDTLLRDFDPECGSEQADMMQYMMYAPDNHTFRHVYSTVDWMVFPPHRATSGVGPPRAYAVSIGATAHGDMLIHHAVVDAL